MLIRMFSRRGGRRLLQLTVASAILGAAAVAGAATTGVFSGSARVSGEPSFAVLSGPTVSLPSGSFTPVLRQVGGRLGVKAHLALASGESQLFAVASRDGQYLCLTVRSADATANTCRLQSGLRKDDVIWIRRADSGGASDLFGLVADGIDSAKAGALSAKPGHNVFVIRDIPASVTDLVVDGPGIHRDLSLGAPEGVPTTTVG
jgi:hypothetical protein